MSIASTSLSAGVATTSPTRIVIISAVHKTWLRDLTASQLEVVLMIRPARAIVKAPVTFTLTMSDSHAVGAFGYELKFGDGTSRTIAVPQYCLVPPGRPAHATWRFTHRYSKIGRYRVSVLGYVNCTSTRALRAITVVITS